MARTEGGAIYAAAVTAEVVMENTLVEGNTASRCVLALRIRLTRIQKGRPQSSPAELHALNSAPLVTMRPCMFCCRGGAISMQASDTATRPLLWLRDSQVLGNRANATAAAEAADQVSKGRTAAGGASAINSGRAARGSSMKSSAEAASSGSPEAAEGVGGAVHSVGAVVVMLGVQLQGNGAEELAGGATLLQGETCGRAVSKSAADCWDADLPW